MDLNKQLGKQRDAAISPREEKIRETIQKGKDVYFRQEGSLGWWEFLWSQLCYTRKRWWALQGALLLFAAQQIPGMKDDFYRVRSIGVIGCLFVVLMIPELWRNRETDATQVEASCLYSLRQIYAARITLFGIVDVALLTLFGLSLGSMGYTLTDVLSQFLLPVTVTACICFSLLCGKHNWSQTVSLSACLLWGAAWWLLLMNEKLYTRIVPAVWVALFAMALMFLVLAIRRAVREVNQHWEATLA